MIDPDPGDPEKPIPPEEKGNPLPVEGGKLAVHEKVLHLLFPFHSQGLETVSGSKGSKGEGKVEGVKIKQGHVGRFLEEDLALSALDLETHAPADLRNLYVAGPRNGVLEGSRLFSRAGQAQNVVGSGDGKPLGEAQGLIGFGPFEKALNCPNMGQANPPQMALHHFHGGPEAAKPHRKRLGD
jgi:hypothetical protein